MATSRVEILVYLDNIVSKVGTYSLSGIVNAANDANQTNLNMGRFANNTNANSMVDKYILQPSPIVSPVDPGTGLPVGNAVFPPRGGVKAYNYLARKSYNLDLYPNDTQIPITYQISDLLDISSVNSSYTKTISIPETHNNMEAFAFISDLSSNSTFNPNKKSRAYVLVDSIIVMEGYIQLTNIVRNDNTGVTNLQCVIFADNDNLWKNIADRELTDLDLREMDHGRTVQSITQSWTKGPDELGYFYPLIDYGSSGDQSYALTDLSPAYGDWTLYDIGGIPASSGGIGGNIVNQPWVATSLMYPAVYVKTIIDKIFSQAGYQYKSNFFNSSYFKTLMVPFSRTVLKKSPSFEWDKIFRVGMGYIPAGTGNPTQHGTWSMVMSTTIAPSGVIRNVGRVPGIGNITSTGALDYNYDNVRIRFTDSGFNFNDGYNYPWNIEDRDPGKNWATQSFVYNSALTATSSGGYTGKIKQRFGVYYKIIENHIPTAGSFNIRPSYLTVRRSRDRNGNTFSSWNNNTYAGTNNLDANAGDHAKYNPEGAVPVGGLQLIQTPTGNGFFYSEGTIKFGNPATVSYWTYSTSRVEQRTYEGVFYTDWLKNDDLSNVNNVDYPTTRGEQFYLEYNAGWGRTFAGFTASQICPETYIWNEFYPDDSDVNDAEPIDMNQVLPLKVKQRDFLMSVIKMFNLIVEPNKNDFYPNILTIEPRDDFYGSGEVKDWTNKLDRKQDIGIQVLGETQNKSTTFKFKDDSDFYNQKYVEKWKEQYGQYKYVTDNDFIEGEKKVEVIFSPTPTVAIINSRGFIIPKISKLSGNQFNRSESNIRIVRKNTAGVIENPYGEYWGLGLSSSHTSPVAAGSYFTFSYYPYVGHFDNPYSPKDDLNFGQTAEIFYNASTTVTNQNLFTKYWYNQMTEYSDKDSRVVTGMFYLRPQDIYDFRFSDKIYIDNQYYKVLKISDYDAANPYGTTKVQMIKSKFITTPYKEVLRNFLSYPNNNGSITALGGQRNLILSSGAGAIGTGNIINDASAGTTVFGTNNNLLGFNNSAIVSGNQNVIGIAVDGANVFGSSNSVSENSMATIFGNRNITSPSSSVSFFGSDNFVGSNVSAHVVGSNNKLNTAHASTNEVSTVFGYNNTIGTNSTSTHILGSYNTVAASGTASNITHILGDYNNVIPTSLSTNELSIVHVVGSSNTVYPTITPLNTVFGSRNIVGTNSIAYIVGSDNAIAAAVTQSIVMGSNNVIDSSSATVFGDNNSVPSTTYNSKIFGNNITFSPTVQNTTAIGRNINAVESNKVYISDVIISGGTGSAFSLANTLLVGADPENQSITGTVSIVRGSISGSSLQIAPLFTRLDSGGGYEETYIQRSTYTGGSTFSVRTGSYYSGTVKTLNLIELDVQAMVSFGSGSGEMYWSKTTRLMDNNAALIGVEDEVIKSTLTSGRDIVITFVKTGTAFDIVIYIPGSASNYDFLIKAKRTTLGPAI